MPDVPDGHIDEDLARPVEGRRYAALGNARLIRDDHVRDGLNTTHQLQAQRAHPSPQHLTAHMCSTLWHLQMFIFYVSAHHHRPMLAGVRLSQGSIPAGRKTAA